MQLASKPTYILHPSYVLGFLISEDEYIDRDFIDYLEERVEFVVPRGFYADLADFLKCVSETNLIKPSDVQKLFSLFLELGLSEVEINNTEVIKMSQINRVSFKESKYLYLSELYHSKILQIS